MAQETFANKYHFGEEVRDKHKVSHTSLLICIIFISFFLTREKIVCLNPRFNCPVATLGGKWTTTSLLYTMFLSILFGKMRPLLFQSF